MRIDAAPPDQRLGDGREGDLVGLPFVGKTMNRHIWTDTDLAYLRRWYRKRPTSAIAEHVGVTLRAVYAMVQCVGLGWPKPGIGSRIRTTLRRLHARGYSDSEIAEVVDCSRSYVSQHRRTMGLASNAYNARYRARVRAKTAEQCRLAGVPNLGAYRAMIYGKRAAAAGWPEDLRPRHVEILDLLYDHGPKTRREIADALGMPWKGSRKSLVSNDPEGSYLAHLQAHGFVVCLARKLPMGGQGKNVSLYMIPPYVRRDEKKRKESQCQEKTAAERRSGRSKTRRVSRTNSAG